MHLTYDNARLKLAGFHGFVSRRGKYIEVMTATEDIFEAGLLFFGIIYVPPVYNTSYRHNENSIIACWVSTWKLPKIFEAAEAATSLSPETAHFEH